MGLLNTLDEFFISLDQKYQYINGLFGLPILDYGVGMRFIDFDGYYLFCRNRIPIPIPR